MSMNLKKKQKNSFENIDSNFHIGTKNTCATEKSNISYKKLSGTANEVSSIGNAKTKIKNIL
jgi:hypothetical protein